MKKTAVFNDSSQMMTINFNKFNLNVDFPRGRLFVEFDFVDHKISLEDYQAIINEFECFDTKLQAMEISRKPVSEITVSEFIQLTNELNQ